MGSIEGDVDWWPGGYAFVFQGTVAEDATGGTHVCSLTVTPGAGNEFQFLYGEITVGNTATAQTADAFIDDGTNRLVTILNPLGNALTTANSRIELPRPSGADSSALLNNVPPGFGSFLVSGTMRLILRVSTTAVSVTQTFAVVLRVRADAPTTTLADTVGTPTLTQNTDGFF